MFKLSSSTYNIRHYNEIKRYFDKGSRILHIVNADQNINKNICYSFDSKIETKYIKINEDIETLLSTEEGYDLIVVTDIFELTSEGLWHEAAIPSLGLLVIITIPFIGLKRWIKQS